MSRFGDKINELMSQAGMTAEVLASATGVSEGHISKLRNGLQTWVSPDHFEGLATALSSNEVKHAELLQAYLLDQCRGPGAHLITITIQGRTADVIQETSGSELNRLPAALRADVLVVVKELEFDRDLRNVITGVANLVAPERAVTNPKPHEVTYGKAKKRKS